MNNIKAKRGFACLMVIAFFMLLSTQIVWSGPIEESNQIVQQWMKAFHEGNAEALSALFAKDGVYIPWAGPFPVLGREAIRPYFEGFFRLYPIKFLTLRDMSTKVYGDTAIFTSYWSFIYGDGKGSIKTVYGRSNSTNTIVEGQRLILIQSTSLLSVAGP